MYHGSVIVTGGLGQVGSYLSERLVSQGVDVTILDNMTSASRFRAENTTLIKGDIRDKALVNSIIKNCDAIVHCAAQISVAYSIEDPFFDADNNIFGTLNLLNAARRSNIERFIYFSSAAVYGNPIQLPVDEQHPLDPLNPYGASKLSGEKYTLAFQRLYGLPSTAIRPFNIYSPRQDPSNPYAGVISRFIERALKGKPPIIFGDGTATRDFVSVHDVVDMVLLMLEKADAVGTAFNCGTGRATSIGSLAHNVIKLCGADGLKPIYQPPRLGDGKNSSADISLAKKVLGYNPKCSLIEGLKEIIDHKKDKITTKPVIAS